MCVPIVYRWKYAADDSLLSSPIDRRWRKRSFDTTAASDALYLREGNIMDPVSATPVLIEEDLKLTAYRLEVARSMPQDPYRDALIAGLGARLTSFGREVEGFPGVKRGATCSSAISH